MAPVDVSARDLTARDLAAHRAALQRFADAVDALLAILELDDPAAAGARLVARPGRERDAGAYGNALHRRCDAAAVALAVADRCFAGVDRGAGAPRVDVRDWHRIYDPYPALTRDDLRARCHRGLGRLDQLIDSAVASALAAPPVPPVPALPPFRRPGRWRRRCRSAATGAAGLAGGVSAVLAALRAVGWR